MQSRRSGKVEIRTVAEARAWATSPVPAVLLRINLTEPDLDALLAGAELSECSFLGCELGPRAAAVLPFSGAFRMDALKGLAFDPFRSSLYSPHELYDHFDPSVPQSYEACFDRLVYRSVSDPATLVQHVIDVDIALMRRLHDAAIGEALAEVLPLNRRQRCVAVMGGHDEPRTSATYRRVAELARDLTRQGFVIATGGGPGVMEAANMGAYLGGFSSTGDASELGRSSAGLGHNDDERLDAVLAILAEGPGYSDEQWLSAGFRAWRALGRPDQPLLSESFGIPTWFYGHEPPNVFATHIAKYFENSLREEGLLAIALGGVIFAPGNAGTVQEIFQDACQNYYRTYDNTRSPMILFGSNYWDGNAETPKAKPVRALLSTLATEKGFDSLVHSTDDPAAIKTILLENQSLLTHP